MPGLANPQALGHWLLLLPRLNRCGGALALDAGAVKEGLCPEGKRWGSLGFASLICKEGLSHVIPCWFQDVVVVERPQEGRGRGGWSLDARPRRKGNQMKKGPGLKGSTCPKLPLSGPTSLLGAPTRQLLGAVTALRSRASLGMVGEGLSARGTCHISLPSADARRR